MGLMSFFDAFGARATGDRLARMQRSPQFSGGTFKNSVETNKMVPG